MGLNATQAALLVAAVVAGTRLFHLYGADEVEIDLDFAAVHESRRWHYPDLTPDHAFRLLSGGMCCKTLIENWGKA